MTADDCAEFDSFVNVLCETGIIRKLMAKLIQ